MKKMMTAVAAVMALAAAGAAQAEGYVGAGIGATHGNIDCTGASTCDTSDVGGKIFGGYKFTPNLGIEGGYVSFGKVKGEGTLFGSPAAASQKTSSFYVAAAGFVDFSPEWNGVARLGVASTKADIDASIGAQSGSDSQTHTDAFFGLGVGYRVTKNFTVSLDADFTRSEYADEKMSVRMLGVSGVFSF